ncbi:putative polyprotein [Thika virus]|uniref:putative polyprotein n=1 Tax=Thika virus TaxID=1654356 RepID=UPI00062CCEF7|nr:putative polyprotein [Thika virus]AKH40285.1 putative polyprotein [Thika virus]
MSFIQNKYNVRLSNFDGHTYITRYYISHVGVNPIKSQPVAQPKIEPHQQYQTKLTTRKRKRVWDDMTKIGNHKTEVQQVYTYGIMDFSKKMPEEPTRVWLDKIEDVNNDLEWDDYDQIILSNSGTKADQIEVEDPNDMGTIMDCIISTITSFLTRERITKTIRITSPLTAIITNLAVLYQMEKRAITTTAIIALLGLHIAALIETLLDIYNVKNIAFDFINHHVTNAIKEYLVPVIMKPIHWVKSNSSTVISTILGWIKPVMSIIFLTVSFFIPNINIDEWCKTVNTRITTVDKLSSATNDLSNKIMEDLCGIDIYGSKLIVDTRREIAEEGIELSKIPTEVFIRDLVKRKQLFNYTQKATSIMSEKLPTNGQEKLVRTIAPFNTMINNNIKLLAEIIKTIEECTQLPSRPPTIGVLLSGEPGVGKSKFSEYAMRKIAANLTLDDSIYSVSRNGDYFDPYGGEHFGIHDEFLYARSDDPIIPTLTKLLSGEYYNLEGAAIHNKRQTCEMKMVSFTSNGTNPTKNLLVKINENAVKAIWDRMVRVNVIDKQVTSRHDTTGNTHRKPDFTHLHIEMTISTEHQPGQHEYVRVTPQEYVMYFTFRLASNIKNFSKDHEVGNLFPMEKIDEYITNHKQQFENLNSALMIAANQANIDLNNIKKMSFVRSNNSSRQFFVVRLEGRGGTGKTTTAHHVAGKLGNIFSMKKIEVSEQFPEPDPYPCIDKYWSLLTYIVDDILTHVNSDQYLSWINKTHMKSIVIIVTNIKFPTRWTWKFDTYTDLSGFSESSGIARRIGIEGFYKHNKDYSFVNTLNSTQVLMEDTMTIQGEQYDVIKLTNLIYKKFIDFVAQTRTVTIVQDNHSIERADITVCARNYKTFTDALSSKSALISGYLRPSKDFSVVLSSLSILEDFRNLSSPDVFTMGAITNGAEFQANVMTLVEKLCIYKHDAKVIIEIEEENISAGYINRCLYINKDIFNVSAIVKHNGTSIYIPRDGQLFTVDLQDLAFLKATKVAQKSVTDLSASEVDIINKYIKKDAELANLLQYYTYSYQIDKEFMLEKKSFYSKYKHLFRCIVLLTGICSTIYASIKIYKYFTKNTDESKQGEWDPLYCNPNTAVGEDHATTQKIQQRYMNEYGRTGDHQYAKKLMIEEYGQDQWNKAEWDMRSNQKQTKQTKQERPERSAIEYIGTGQWESLRDHWKLYPNDIPTFSSNQVTPDMIKFQSNNQIEMLSNTIANNTVTITTINNSGNNYAIGICGPYLLSVAHGMKDITDPCYITNNDQRYPVTCVYLNRDRDIAIFKIKNNNFSFKDIRCHFGDSDLFTKTKEGYFIRPIHTDRTIAACAIRYTAKRNVPLPDPSNPNFSPSEGLYTTLFATTGTPIFIKRGDCGLPLVVRTSNGLKIVGIHNAITLTNMAFFASVSTNDFKDIGNSVISNTSMYHYHKPRHAFNTHEWYEHIMTDVKRQAKVPSQGLVVLGYHPEAHLPSFPKDSHRELLDAQTRNDIGEKLPTKPSALIYKPHLMSDSKLVKDRNGVPHTLWTQSVKYAKREPLYQQWDKEIYKHTMQLIHQRITRDYGKPKFLSLYLNINGDGTTNNKPWDITTSAGPLLKKLYNVHTKEAIFDNKAPEGKQPSYVFNDTEAAKHVREMYEMYCKGLEQGTPMAIWCKDNRKVELLPAPKVHEGKVRLFNEMDLSVNMTLKKYFGHMLTKILETHVEAPYKIGMDVYSEATIYHKKMSKIDGNLLSTDISGCDKSMPKEIIYEFCRAFCQGYDEKLVTALAESLTYTTHIMDGVIYLVDNGNESGSYVTTMLNCFAMEVITMYPVVEQLLSKGIRPSLQNIEDVMSAIYYGDDRSVKFSKELNITELDLVRCGAYFNFKVTPAKVQSDFISFCSREFIPDEDHVVFPQLKESSVLSCLFWIKKKETKFIQANINVALFEASLHRKEFFLRVVNIVETILAIYPEVSQYIHIYDYEVYRKVFKNFIYNECKSPVLLKTEETEVAFEEEIIQNLEQLNIQANNYSTTIKIMDYVSHINHKAQKSSLEPLYKYERTGAQESPVWRCTLTYNGNVYHASARTKKEAQQKAAEQCVTANNNPGSQPKLVLNMQDYHDLLINEAFFQPYCKAGFASVGDSKLSVNLEPEISVDELKMDLADNNFNIESIQYIKVIIDKNLVKKMQVLIGDLHVRQNNDQPIEPAMINQAAMGQQRATLPSQTNPQPTGINPAMTHDGDDIMGAVTTAMPETLNPIGAPDMLAVGAITFDIKDLIYQQFLDCDTQLVVSDDAVEGSIIAQIPYGLHSDYINSYIKYYAQAHERFNGSLQFRFTVIGNPLFSGAIGIAWYPRKITSKTMPISELMKYSYQAEGVTTPWNKIHILHDARRQHFYRLVEDEDSDYDSRPHLILFLMMSLQNPLKEGVQTRIRIASKLANSAEPNPFTFSNPDVLAKTPALATSIPGIGTYQGMNVANTFPHVLNIDDNIYTDGILAAPQVFKYNGGYGNLKTSGPLIAPFINIEQTTGSAWWRAGDSVQFKSNQNYLWDTTSTGESAKRGRPTLLPWSNLPNEQYIQFMNALYIQSGGNSPNRGLELIEETPDDSTTSIPTKLYELFAKAINSLRSDYVKTGFMVTGMLTYRPDTTGRNRFGSIKIVTTHGVVVFDISIMDVLDKQIDLSTQSSNQSNNISTTGYGAIDVPYSINHPYSNLPTGYQILRIGNQTVSAVITSTITTPTSTDDATVAMYYKRIAEPLTITECIQFELQDSISYRNIATVRYLQEFGIFVINTHNNNPYALFGQKFSELYLTNPVTIARSNAFPLTDTSTWINRQADVYRQTLELDMISSGMRDIEVISNSMIVGGMLRSWRSSWTEFEEQART